MTWTKYGWYSVSAGDEGPFIFAQQLGSRPRGLDRAKFLFRGARRLDGSATAHLGAEVAAMREEHVSARGRTVTTLAGPVLPRVQSNINANESITSAFLWLLQGSFSILRSQLRPTWQLQRYLCYLYLW